jgi:hypothetical protein
MNASPIPALSAALIARDLPKGSDILSPLLASNGAALVRGPAGIGKSFFALYAGAGDRGGCA